MEDKRRKHYAHEKLMQKLNLSKNDLPAELREAYNEFHIEDAKVEGYQPLLEPASNELSNAIREWFDEHEEENYPIDENEKACYVAFYVVGMTEITPAQFRELGGKVRLNGKNAYKLGDKYQLDVENQKKGTYKIRSLVEEQD